MTFKSASFKGYEIEMRRSRKMRSVPLWDNLRRELQIVTNVFKYNDSFHSEHYNNVKIIIFRKGVTMSFQGMKFNECQEIR